MAGALAFVSQSKLLGFRVCTTESAINFTTKYHCKTNYRYEEIANDLDNEILYILPHFSINSVSILMAKPQMIIANAGLALLALIRIES